MRLHSPLENLCCNACVLVSETKRGFAGGEYKVRERWKEHSAIRCIPSTQEEDGMTSMQCDLEEELSLGAALRALINNPVSPCGQHADSITTKDR